MLLESTPRFRTIMQASPSTHFVSFAQAILYRGAGLELVWERFLACDFDLAVYFWRWRLHGSEAFFIAIELECRQQCVPR